MFVWGVRFSLCSVGSWIVISLVYMMGSVNVRNVVCSLVVLVSGLVSNRFNGLVV